MADEPKDTSEDPKTAEEDDEIRGPLPLSVYITIIGAVVLICASIYLTWVFISQAQ